MTRRVVVSGVAAISQFGPTWRGLGAALQAPSSAPFPGVPAETPLANPRARNARKMMSRGAYLAAAALADLMRDVGWTAAQRELAGYFLGVGASGGSLDDVTALLDASIIFDPARDNAPGMDPYGFSLPAFGTSGLAACNPLLAFQLMNNFTLAHGAIFEGLGGPNGALFSRGTGTTAALIEAVHAIASGDCDLAVAGGADSPTHPVTRAELAREGFLARGLHPSEGAALLALAREPGGGEPGDGEPGDVGTAAVGARVVVEGCGIASGRQRDLSAAIHQAVGRTRSKLQLVHVIDEGVVDGGVEGGIDTGTDLVVVAAWGPPAADAAHAWTAAHCPTATVVDTAPLGATLAAAPALGWVAAIDLLASGRFERALVLDLGVDGDVGAVALSGSNSGALQVREVAA